MKRSFNIALCVVLAGGALSLLAKCPPCERGKKKMAKEMPAPAAMPAPAPAPQPMPAPAKMAPAAKPAPMPAPAAKPAPTAAPAEKPAMGGGNRVEVSSEADFNAQLKKPKVIVLFSTTWCGPCKALKPIFEQVTQDNPGITFVHVDGDQLKGLVSKYKIIGFPTVKFFKGGAEVGQTYGAADKAELQGLINSYLK